MTDDFESIQANLADLSTVLALLRQAGHAISDSNAQQAGELLREGKSGLESILRSLGQPQQLCTS